MYIERVPNRNSPPAVLLRESYREGKKVKKRTLANLSKLPDEVVDNLRLSLKGAKVVNQEELPELCRVLRSLPHGHVACVLGTINKLGIPQLIESKKTRRRDLAVAMIVSRIINPTSKLGTVRGIRAETANSSLGELLGLSHGDRNEYYEALDWLLSKQIDIENALASRHLENGSLILYLKTIDLKVRPIYHYLDHRVKGHIFLCFLAYYVEWHMRKALESILFEEEEIEKIDSSDLEGLLRYQPSLTAKQKAGNKRNQENLPVHSFSTLLADLATIAQNKIQINLQGEKVTFDKITQPTALQQKVLDLLGVSLICTQ